MSPKKTLLSSEYTKRIPANELSTLLKVSSTLAASLDLNVVLQTAIESAVEVMRLETGAIYLLEEDEQLTLGATTPPLDPALKQTLQSEPLKGHPHLLKALTLRRPIYITDTQLAQLSPAESAIIKARHLKSILFIPLLLEAKATGAIIVGTIQQVRTFTHDEVDLCLVLAYQIALAVANARLYKSVQQSNFELTRAYDATLQGWSNALELRDQETQGHTQRVTRLTEKLARKMGIPDCAMPHIRRGALLHDIGKMSIPDSILKKDGPLSAEEMAVMRKHPETAYQFLMPIDYLSPALDIPLFHHEKWDGTGYPRGLKGEEIPLFARIFAVADVYDALTSDRPYRKAWREVDALNYIAEQAGKHFDPLIVKIFLEEIIAEGELDDWRSENEP